MCHALSLRTTIAAAIVVLLFGPLHAIGAEIAGPVRAELVRVIDGDTFIVDALVWPGHRVRVSIRLRGVDAPEMRSRCAAEKEAAIRARDALAGLIGSEPVAISNIGGGKYYGRVLADAHNGRGEDIGVRLLEGGFARPYVGGRRKSNCPKDG